jgi:hypothetical protein
MWVSSVSPAGISICAIITRIQKSRHGAWLKPGGGAGYNFGGGDPAFDLVSGWAPKRWRSTGGLFGCAFTWSTGGLFGCAFWGGGFWPPHLGTFIGGALIGGISL